MSGVDDLVNAAEALELEDRFGEARDRWQQAAALEARPDFVARIGRCFFLDGQYSEAESAWLENLATAPEHPDAYFYLGYLYQKTGRLEEALPVLQEGLKLKQWSGGYTLLGAVQRRLERNSEARVNFRRAIELDNEDDEAWNLLGTITEDPREARDSFQLAIAANPTNVNAYRGLGEVHWKLGDLLEAERWFRKAIEVNEDDPWSHNFLGQMLMDRNALSEAEKEFRRAVGLMSDAPLFYCRLGEVLERQQRRESAASAYRSALAIDGSNYLANLRYGQLLRSQGASRKAMVYARRALAAAPTDRRIQELIQDLTNEVQAGE